MKVLIKSAGASFRRAGIQATRDGVIVDTDNLSEERMAALQGERMISISAAPEEEGDVEKADKKAADKKKAR